MPSDYHPFRTLILFLFNPDLQNLEDIDTVLRQSFESDTAEVWMHGIESARARSADIVESFGEYTVDRNWLLTIKRKMK